jgi:hypothetical protein
MILVAAGSIVVGCGLRQRPAASIHTLEWRDFHGGLKFDDDPNKALYILDGKDMGRGNPGLDRVMMELRRLPTRSELRIRWHDAPIDSSAPIYTPPYQERFEEFAGFLRDRGIVVHSMGSIRQGE